MRFLLVTVLGFTLAGNAFAIDLNAMAEALRKAEADQAAASAAVSAAIAPATPKTNPSVSAAIAGISPSVGAAIGSAIASISPGVGATVGSMISGVHSSVEVNVGAAIAVPAAQPKGKEEGAPRRSSRPRETSCVGGLMNPECHPQ